jgi:recombination protein RecR
VTRLIDEFSRLPGVGPKTAARLTYFLLRAPEEQSLALGEALRDLKAMTRLCLMLQHHRERPCPICCDEKRDHSVICVVEEPLDAIAIDRARELYGRVPRLTWSDQPDGRHWA